MTAYVMSPSFFNLVRGLPCEEREKILLAIIEAYSNHMQQCHDARVDLQASIESILDIEEQS